MEMNVSMNLGVDAGNISVLSLDYVKENGGELPEDRLRLALNLKPNTIYSFKVKISKTWNGPVNRRVMIKTGESGQVFIGDACYAFSNHDKWMAFLEKTDYLKSMESTRGLSLDTGGDGEFKVSAVVEEA